MNDKIQHKAHIDSRLFLNERSILSQDPAGIDLRLKIFKEIKKPIGDLFLPRIQQVLEINNELNDFLEDEGVELSDRMYNDLKNLQLMFRKQLSKFLDKWSFEVLSDIDRDMTYVLNESTIDLFVNSNFTAFSSD